MQREKKNTTAMRFFSEILINSSGNFILQRGQQIKKTEE